eukprot:2401990-Rhodomonas_salina.1
MCKSGGAISSFNGGTRYPGYPGMSAFWQGLERWWKKILEWKLDSESDRYPGRFRFMNRLRRFCATTRSSTSGN